MSRALQYVAESTWTAEEAMAWARSKKNWPTRRFRVEGSYAGNSRLLPKKLAERTREKYGGKLVEVIPLPTISGEPKKTLNQSRVADMPACPKCGAGVGWACKAKLRHNGAPLKPCPPHKARVKAQADAWAKALDASAAALKAATKKERKPRAKRKVADGE
jgi:hypothetical protein